MDLVEEHPHSFLPATWPFSEPVNTAAFTSTQVLQKTSPILLVFHDDDGEWQFLHDEVSEEDECRLICLGCALERDFTLAKLADLPAGWMATRATVEHPWIREPYESSEEDAE